MNETMDQTVSHDDQVMAALAHGAAILPFWGLIGAIVIWATQKDTSRFVRFQALQALIYQVLPLLGGVFFFICYFCSFGSFFLTIPLAALADQGGVGGGEVVAVIAAILTTGLPFIIFGVATLIWLAWLIYAIVGAVRVFQGQDFRYIVVGPWLERTLERREMMT
jgi:uncharacterized Tic20 family protein